ncbi:MAG: hypothetical protein JWQ38_1657 [Flavipsychrobacter sp.]|nr:hypothetical protein [Flavipsychrobacter sp.]
MKKQLLSVLFVLAGISAFGQWQATNLTSVTYLPIVMETHNNTMYATVFNGFTATLNKLNSDNTSWTAIPTSSVITVPRFMKSAGTRMYMSSINSGVYSMVYYTTDGGANFIPDTVGLPPSFSGVAIVGAIQYHKGKVFVAMAGNGYYMKDTADVAWHSVNCPTMFNAPLDPLTFYNGTLYGYDNTGTNTLYTSTDYGSNWTVVASNLPSDFNTTMITADDVSGRLYAAGSWGGSPLVYGLKYSDDGGKTWTTSTEAAPFINKNYNNTQQQITAIYAHSPTLYLALENNKDLSAPNIVGSTTGLAGLAYDTVGLPTNAPGAANGIKFQVYQDKLALCLNVIDVYLKGTPNGIKEQQVANNNFTIFPNPCRNTLAIQTTGKPATEIRIMDYTGKTAMTLPGTVKEAELSSLRSGLYLIQFINDGSVTEIQKFIKE